MKLGYYPGCSLHGSGREFSESLGVVIAALGVELKEVQDWACCGASSAHVTNHLLGVALPARTLALAEQQGLQQVMAPCAACYNRLAGARRQIMDDAALAARVARVLERPFSNSVEVLSIVQVLRDLASEIKSKATRPLAGLKVACYYGCLLVRPVEVTGFDDPEQPTSMETIVAAAGGEPVAWNMKLACCGGGFSISRTPSVVRLGREILADARKHGADVVLVACPMCHSNLDFRQQAMARRGVDADLPVLYVTELVGLALGVDPRRLGLQRHFVDAAPLLKRLAGAPAARTEA